MGIGTDVVDLARLSRQTSLYGSRFGDRVLTPREKRWCNDCVEPLRRVAICFAIKESVIKARGGRAEPFRWSDIETMEHGYTAESSCSLEALTAYLAALLDLSEPQLGMARVDG